MIQDFKYTAALTNTPVLVNTNFKPGSVYLLYVDAFNDNASKSYIQMFDTDDVANVTLGVTTPDWVHPIPRDGGHDTSYTPNDYFQGIKFKDGLVVAATTTRGGSTAPGTDIDVNFFLV